MNSVKSYIDKIRYSLQDIYPSEEVEQLISIIFLHCCQFDRAHLILNKSSNLSESQYRQIDCILERLMRNEPIQYILGEASFLDFSFRVAPGVLIPRPETEELVYLIKEDYKGHTPSILDIGTGSGCIAISLSKLIAESSVTAFDISPLALETATENAFNLKAKVSFKLVDILNFKPNDHQKYDVIVSNPPYICEREKESMHDNVLTHEPHLALFVDDSDPLLFYRTIATHGLKMLNTGGRVYFEINALFGNETALMLKELGYTDIEVIKDFYQKDRIVKATLL